MASINKVLILGYVGNDPDMRTTQSGTTIANISVATTEKWTDKHNGSKQERTEWHKCVFFGKVAEVIQQYITKGSQLHIEGQLRTEKWTDQQGVDHYTTKIYGRELVMLGGGQQNRGNQQQPQQGAYQQPQGQGQAAPANYTAPRPANPQHDQPVVVASDEYNQDVPF